MAAACALKVAVFANGCFWGSEKGIWRLPAGIHSTAVGYCAGFTPNPTYEEACSGYTGHTEGVRVVYDPSKVHCEHVEGALLQAVRGPGPRSEGRSCLPARRSRCVLAGANCARALVDAPRFRS